MSTNRLMTLLAVVGLILLGVWIARHTTWEETEVPTPLQNEAATNPFYAAQKFTRELGIDSAWERVLTRVPTEDVIVVSSWHWTLVEGRHARLEKWVENGGRLVVDHSLIGGEREFKDWSGIQFRRTPLPDEEESEDDDAEAVVDEDDTSDEVVEVPGPGGADQCAKLHQTVPEGGPANLAVCGIYGKSSLIARDSVEWALANDAGTQVVRVRVGRGKVTVINTVPFRYRDFLDGDHAALLVAAGQLRRGDTVHFLSEEKQTSLVSLMWTYGWPAVLLTLALIALALWRNSVRFGPLVAEPELARRSLAEQIRGTGVFAVRFGAGKALHAAAVRALDEAAQRRLPAYPRLSSVDRVKAIAELTGIDAGTLGPAIHHSGPRRSHELRQAIALIESARRQLLIRRH